MIVTHGACGKSWNQAGNRTSHCGGCHETFVSLSVFDKHRKAGECIPASEVIFRKEPLAQREDGVWFSPAAVEAARVAFKDKEEDIDEDPECPLPQDGD